MSYEQVGTAGDLVRFGCALKVGIEGERTTVHRPPRSGAPEVSLSPGG